MKSLFVLCFKFFAWAGKSENRETPLTHKELKSSRQKDKVCGDILITDKLNCTN